MIRPVWHGLQWPDAAVFILASGPSLTQEQCACVRRWRDAADNRRVIVVNTTFRLAPWADVLYACDAPWWTLHHVEVRRDFKGELWTQDQRATQAFGIHLIRSMAARGLGKQPGVIHQGMNGGYQAVNLAYQAGARRLFLLGFDMKGGHWHAPHPSPALTNPVPHLFRSWIEHFRRLADDLQQEAVEVVNCTPDSALQCFPQIPLEHALAAEALRETELT